MKKSFKVLVVLMLVLSFTVGVCADNLVRDVPAKENRGITVTYNGTPQILKDGAGNIVYPVIIGGTTYLPAKAVANIFGASTTWDNASKTVGITSSDFVSDDGSIPTDLEPTKPATTPSTSTTTPSAPSTTRGKTLGDPALIGDTIVMSFSGEYADVPGFSFTNAMTFNSITDATAAEMTAFKMRSESGYTYKKINLTMKITNIKISGGTDYLFLTATRPYFAGTKSDTHIIIGSGDTYADNSVDSALRNAAKDSAGYVIKITSASEAKSITATGDVIVAYKTGDTNVRARVQATSGSPEFFLKIN